MRSTAQQLRDGQAAGKTAHAEQQIADALDSVVRKMGAADAGGAKGGTKAETGQLAGDLDAVRDARDRVARLEKRCGDLQQNQAARGQGGQSSGTAAANGFRRQPGTATWFADGQQDGRPGRRGGRQRRRAPSTATRSGTAADAGSAGSPAARQPAVGRQHGDAGAARMEPFGAGHRSVQAGLRRMAVAGGRRGSGSRARGILGGVASLSGARRATGCAPVAASGCPTRIVGRCRSTSSPSR